MRREARRKLARRRGLGSGFDDGRSVYVQPTGARLSGRHGGARRQRDALQDQGALSPGLRQRHFDDGAFDRLGDVDARGFLSAGPRGCDDRVVDPFLLVAAAQRDPGDARDGPELPSDCAAGDHGRDLRRAFFRRDVALRPAAEHRQGYGDSHHRSDTGRAGHAGGRSPEHHSAAAIAIVSALAFHRHRR